ncbi:proteasome complex subunit Rpn13 ubiquitin receptor-domain-containing protein [Multifurca ochricompacta]|uniref:Proteasome complex subunit Rpn13 ubiquitin receptor-domain-containing protein n=1 Tax=Multifurca ochricompacta TaxID=376703 RepID=A0AAD4M9D0_9AGAM|nr:proteasome complex subunit Rpn13 ubiquitin receptor-domain-containing protein [Multifurca ochricompacta]
MPLTERSTILAFKAGRAFRREGTDVVEPSAEKGAVVIERGEDELLHFMWKNRVTEETEEDLILFPTDASFVSVTQASGRVYVLKFSSSDQRHFFWMQDASSERDEEFAFHVNRLLQIPGYIPVWGVTDSTSQTPGGSSSAQPGLPQGAFRQVWAWLSPHRVISSVSQPTPEQLSQLRSLVAQMSGSTAVEPELSLTDVLTPDNLNPLFISHPELIRTIFPHLPPDLPASLHRR